MNPRELISVFRSCFYAKVKEKPFFTAYDVLNLSFAHNLYDATAYVAALSKAKVKNMEGASTTEPLSTVYFDHDVSWAKMPTNPISGRKFTPFVFTSQGKELLEEEMQRSADRYTPAYMETLVNAHKDKLTKKSIRLRNIFEKDYQSTFYGTDFANRLKQAVENQDSIILLKNDRYLFRVASDKRFPAYYMSLFATITPPCS